MRNIHRARNFKKKVWSFIYNVNMSQILRLKQNRVKLVALMTVLDAIWSPDWDPT